MSVLRLSSACTVTLALGTLISLGCEAPPHGPPPQASTLGDVGSGLPVKVTDAAHDGQAIFDRMCVSCHTVGAGPRIGPDLAGLFERRELDWVQRWMKDPVGMTKTDPDAQRLLAQWKGIQMPPQGLNDRELGSIYAYIRAHKDAASGEDVAVFGGGQNRSGSGVKALDPATLETVDADLSAAPEVSPPTGRTEPAKVVVKLEVRELEMPIAEGVTYSFWTFGGHVPGRFIRVRQGDLVEFHLANHPDNKMPHNIDLHAVTGPGGGATSSFTAPGHSSRFTFRALMSGLYVYHCATAPVGMHVANGMYGLILVEPETPLPPVDREYYIMQGDFYTVGKYREKGNQPFDMQKAIEENATYVVFNGAEGSLVGDRALTAKVGETVRIYFGNGGPNLISSFHVIGEIFDRVWLEGGLRYQEHVQTTLVPAGGATIVDFKVEVPGTYILVDHSLFRAFNKGALGMLKVEGEPDLQVYSGKEVDEIYLADMAATPTGAVAIATEAAKNGTLTEDMQIEAGRTLYKGTCSACHQNDAKGLPDIFPPLAGSDFLVKDKTRAIEIVLNGLSGPVTVNGKTYNSVMAPLSNLNDDAIAHILTYVNRSFGNRGERVLPAEVTKVRETTKRPPGAGE